MESELNKFKSMRIGVLAKYDWYLSDALEVFRHSAHEVMTFNSLAAFQMEIEQNPTFDVLFLPHFSELLPAQIYETYECIGFHTGDLPRDRGGSPIQHKILLGQYTTTVSAFKLGDGIDSGPIYLQEIIDLSQGNLDEILCNLSRICADMMLKIIENQPQPVDQIGDFELRTRRRPDDSLLSSHCESLRSLYDFIRMLDGVDYPRAYLNLGEYKIEFTSAVFSDDEITTKCVIKKKG